uniref:BtIIIB n=3 Tax=Conus TaxID=6490 RepID=M3B_CONBE|nr:RecName: Full=BtIIIB; AltName: Full=Conotoxin BeTXIb [Conus betulinus]
CCELPCHGCVPCCWP